MEIQSITIEEIRSTLGQLRQNPLTLRKFPKQLWNSIIELTKIHPLRDVCSQLDIDPMYLKRKISQTKETTLEFHQITLPQNSNSPITIEISSPDGLRATVHGSMSCTEILYKLFGR